MLSFLGYNFLSDGNSLDPVPTNFEQCSNVTLQNGIFDEMYITSKISDPFSNIFPSDWEYYSIMHPKFNGSVDGGASDISESIEDITSIKIKRRVKGETSWLTLQEIPINSTADLNFAFNDVLNESLTDYEYAIVLVNNNVEGAYIIEEVSSKFDGLFISDNESIYKLYCDVGYSNHQRIQKIGTFEPFGRHYPVFVTNSNINYEKGTVTGRILPNEFYDNGEIDPKKISQLRTQMMNFLTNKKPKIIKDWNGNIWLAMIVDNPTVSFDQNYGMKLAIASFNYVEIGNIHNQQDLYNTGFSNSLG